MLKVVILSNLDLSNYKMMITKIIPKNLLNIWNGSNKNILVTTRIFFLYVGSDGYPRSCVTGCNEVLKYV